MGGVKLSPSLINDLRGSGRLHPEDRSSLSTMPGEPAPIKKSPNKKAAEKAPEAEPAPVETPAEPATVETPAEAAAVEDGSATDESAPAAAEGPVATGAPADARAAAPVEEPPKDPTPPPPAVPTSAPLEVSVEDVNDESLTVKWKTPETVGESGLDGYTVEYCKDGNRPKIKIPRNLRTRFVKQVGEQINLVIPFLGKPKPLVSWLKDGQPLDPKRVNIRNSDKDSILFIRGAQREDSGVYELTVKVDCFEDKANITLQIVELPGPPCSAKLVDCWGFNAALEWMPPEDNGNTEITGYIVQKADKKTGVSAHRQDAVIVATFDSGVTAVRPFSQEWFTVLEHYHRLSATISDLIMGNSYAFRVFSVNKVGVSEKSAVTKDVATIQKTGIIYKPPEYQEHDFSEAPKFTTPLSNRAATVGYTTKLLCSVRGSPKPKIEWLKNQMVIGDDPKFRQLSNQGICSLEIRKPCCFDGGVYTCRAKNAQGEATVSCKLEVKQVLLSETEKSK
ncbi:myosin binding protein Ha isoform X4 [Phyllopteryx taeniolatus]|uniref:myosin binding protein Ha isoform X4 n=1 Tax=Phyllopteryx taeniolatus TaxID=161469 RepID=UPI002AD3B6C2|nr:myosin binding protein Ha isoform X4 [Phyllopteryx taeniolatus]